MNFFRCSPHEPDDYGLRSLWRNISLSSQKSDCSSTISKEDLGFTESVLRTFTSPAYAYMESPFNNSVVSPLSDSYQLPDEYLHGLCRTKGLPKIEFQKFPTDLVSLKLYFHTNLSKAFVSFSSCSFYFILPQEIILNYLLQTNFMNAVGGSTAPLAIGLPVSPTSTPTCAQAPMKRASTSILTPLLGAGKPRQ